MKNDGIIFPLIEKASNFPKNKPCPFPKGNYTIKNFVIDNAKFGPLPNGRYLSRGKLIGDKKLLAQIEVYSSMNNLA